MLTTCSKTKKPIRRKLRLNLDASPKSSSQRRDEPKASQSQTKRQAKGKPKASQRQAKASQRQAKGKPKASQRQAKGKPKASQRQAKGKQKGKPKASQKASQRQGKDKPKSKAKLSVLILKVLCTASRECTAPVPGSVIKFVYGFCEFSMFVQPRGLSKRGSSGDPKENPKTSSF